MTDKTTTEVKPTLAASVITKLASTLAEGIKAARNSGNSLADFCAAAMGAKLAVTPAPADVDAIVNAVADSLKWAGTAREKVYKSEARVIVSQHALLPEGITALRTATGSCDYHAAVKVARAIRDHGNVASAVAFLTAERDAKKSDPIANVQRALKVFYKAMQNSKRKTRVQNMSAAAAFAKVLNIDIGAIVAETAAE